MAMQVFLFAVGLSVFAGPITVWFVTRAEQARIYREAFAQGYETRRVDELKEAAQAHLLRQSENIQLELTKVAACKYQLQRTALG